MRESIKIIVQFLFSICFLSCTNPDEVNVQQIIFKDNNIVAHRGAWKANKLPENSIASLKKAIELHCKGSEFDVWITADDSLVVNHDASFNGLLIEESKYKDLSKFKLSNGEKIPTLKEYLIAGSVDNNLTKLFCEIKACVNYENRIYVAEKIYRLVESLNLKQKVIFISYEYNMLKKIRSLDSEIQLQFLGGNVLINQLLNDNINGVNYSFDFFIKSPESIQLFKNNNITLGVWTVNDKKVMSLLIESNFDYITTDEPELLYSQILKTK